MDEYTDDINMNNNSEIFTTIIAISFIGLMFFGKYFVVNRMPNYVWWKDYVFLLIVTAFIFLLKFILNTVNRIKNFKNKAFIISILKVLIVAALILLVLVLLIYPNSYLEYILFKEKK